MSKAYDEGFEELVALREWYAEHSADRNEATTRLHLIDRLFQKCLAWEPEQITAEERLQGQYRDYTFRIQRPLLVVEAKREGETFELPAGFQAVIHSLKSVTRGNANLLRAVTQVADYCQRAGIPLGAVSNGTQLVAFVATRTDGVPPIDGRCAVFPSLEFMAEEFTALWNSLSSDGVSDSWLQSELLGEQRRRVPERLSYRLQRYPGTKHRNTFQADLQILSELVLEDITSARELESDFLSSCYCKSGALSQDALISRNILKNRYASLFAEEATAVTTSPVRTKEGIAPNILAESISRRPILLLGDVGVGKTTFLRWLRVVEGADVLENAVALHIDLASVGTLTPDFREFVIARIDAQLREEYGLDIHVGDFVREVYAEDLARFAKGIHADYVDLDSSEYRVRELSFLESKILMSEEHLKRSLKHYGEQQRRQIVLFLDNSDQREPEIQQKAFLIAQELADSGIAVVFVTLRPSTFHRSVKRGLLTAYHTKAFTIAPPRIDQVLLRRLDFARRITNGEIPISRIKNVSLHLESLDIVLRSFIQTLESNRKIIEAIDNMSSGNVRRALDFVKAFFGSGHVDTEKIVLEFERADKYLVPLHEFLRAVILGDSEYYDPRTSPIANLFDVRNPDLKEHFILPEMICFLMGEATRNPDGGHTSVESVYSHLQGLGFTPDQVDHVLSRAAAHSMFEVSSHTEIVGELGQGESIRATSLGAYHVTRLCRQAVYSDAMLVDTPILDDSYRESLTDETETLRRMERVQEFIAYLSMAWARRGDGDWVFDWAPVAQEVTTEADRVISSLYRPRTRRRRRRHR